MDERLDSVDSYHSLLERWGGKKRPQLISLRLPVAQTVPIEYKWIETLASDVAQRMLPPGAPFKFAIGEKRLEVQALSYGPWIIIGRQIADVLTKDEMEAVLEHEIGHALFEHGKQMAIAKKVTEIVPMVPSAGLAIVGLGNVAAGNDISDWKLLMGIAATTSATFGIGKLLMERVSAPLNHKSEYEADGCVTVPENLFTALEKISKLLDNAVLAQAEELGYSAEDVEIGENLHTHPSMKDRYARRKIDNRGRE